MPNWSRPVALNCWVAPVWTEALAGLTLIVVRTGVAVTVTLAVPLTPPLAAVTVNGPPGVGGREQAARADAAAAADRPGTVSWGLSGLPNWSRPVALNCWVAPVWTETLAGLTLIVVRTGVAVTEATTAKFRVCHWAKRPQKMKQEPVVWLLPQMTPSFSGSGEAPA